MAPRQRTGASEVGGSAKAGGASSGDKTDAASASGDVGGGEGGKEGSFAPSSWSSPLFTVVAALFTGFLLKKGLLDEGSWGPTSASSSLTSRLDRDICQESQAESTLEEAQALADLDRRFETAVKKFQSDFSGLSERVLRIDTHNFATTVKTAKNPVLIAFCDPRSLSFRDLKPHLSHTAEALAQFEDNGEPLGRLGAVDVTIDTFLARMEAPSMQSGWQQESAAFRFSAPRFYPVILMLFSAGQSQFEYTGVVSAPQIVEFMKRLKVPRGGEVLENREELTRLVQRWPGPTIVGCGLSNSVAGAAEAFNETAFGSWGGRVFGKATGKVCDEVFGPFSPPAVERPRLLWIRKGGASPKSTADPKVLGSFPSIARWLSSHKVLEEMTPDNSHKFLDIMAPLVMFLVNTKQESSLHTAEDVVSAVEEVIAEKGAASADFNFVWSSCQEFGSQFSVRKKCMASPVVVVVNPITLAFGTESLRDVAEGGEDARSSLAFTAKALVEWLDKSAAPWRADISARAEAKKRKEERRRAARGRGGNAAGAGDGEEEGQEEGEEVESSSESKTSPPSTGDTDQKTKKTKKKVEEDPAKPSTDPNWFSAAVEAKVGLEDRGKQADAKLLAGYQALLTSLYDLRESIEATHGGDLKFDFSEMDRIQDMHPVMKMLPRADELEEAFRSRPAMTRVWRRVEKAAKTQFQVKANNETLKPLVEVVREGHSRLSELWRKLFRELHELDRLGKLNAPQNRVRQVERRDASDLSVAEFLTEYASKGKPVIITGLKLSKEPWTLDFFAKTCDVSVPLKKKNEKQSTWGRLEDAERLPLPEFIRTFTTNETRKAYYLHDWTLPGGCPKVFGEAPYGGFTMPRYFAGDYFQRSVFSAYQHSWPSLFVGSELTESAIHIDSGNTNFWLYLLSGRKEWKFYSRTDLANLYAKPGSAHFYIDVFRPVPEHFPLLKYATLYEGIQEPGDLVFIPAGNPHGVRNLEPIHGISMNYVDATNVWLYLQDTLVSEFWADFEAFTDNMTIPHGMISTQEDMAFGHWKSRRWRDLKYDLFV